MNNPQGDPLPPPPAPLPPKKKPSCWLIGGLGCLAFLIILGVVGTLGVYSFMHSSAGQKIGAAVQNGMQVGQGIAATQKEMKDIRQALVAYRAAKGHYPKDLSELVPEYLPDATELHSSLDSNSDPAHVSYTYAKPAPDAPATTQVLVIGFTWNLGFTSQQPAIKEFLSITLNGTFIQAMYQGSKQLSRQVLPDRI